MEYCPRQRLTELVRPSIKPQSKSDNGGRYNSYLNLSSPFLVPFIPSVSLPTSFPSQFSRSRVPVRGKYVSISLQFDTNTIPKYVIVLTGFKTAVTRWPSLDSLSPHRHKPPKYMLSTIRNIFPICSKFSNDCGTQECRSYQYKPWSFQFITRKPEKPGRSRNSQQSEQHVTARHIFRYVLDILRRACSLQGSLQAIIIAKVQEENVPLPLKRVCFALVNNVKVYRYSLSVCVIRQHW